MLLKKFIKNKSVYAYNINHNNINSIINNNIKNVSVTKHNIDHN